MPAVYDAATIRAVVLDRASARSGASSTDDGHHIAFLSAFPCDTRGMPPRLLHAMPPVPQRRLAALPRYASPEQWKGSCLLRPATAVAAFAMWASSLLGATRIARRRRLKDAAP